MTMQLTLGLMSGVEKFEPYAVGDVVVKHNGNRYVIKELTHDTYADPGFMCVNLETGNDAIVLEREIAYRSR
jgi:hypothetical protein